jgi:hypothetical protein
LLPTITATPLCQSSSLHHRCVSCTARSHCTVDVPHPLGAPPVMVSAPYQ